MDLTEKTTKIGYKYDGIIIRVRLDDALLPDGRACKREFVEHGGGAAVLCVCDGKIAFVRQYRYAYGEEIIEIPAGKLEKGEDPAVAAVRELHEETGADAESVRLLTVVYPSPGYTNEKIYVYEAQGVTMGAAQPDDDEFLSLEWIAEADAEKMLLNGEFKDSKTAIALFHYFLSRKQNAAK